MEVSQGPAPSAAGRAAPQGAPVPLDPPPKTPNHGFLQQREECLCQRRSFWEPLAAEEFEKEKGGMCPWPCPPCGRRGQGWRVPVGGEGCPSCPAPTPARGLAGGKRFAKGEGGAGMSRGLCASIAVTGIRHGENTAENGGEMDPAGITASREAFPPWHHTSVCLTQECMRSKPRARCPG